MSELDSGLDAARLRRRGSLPITRITARSMDLLRRYMDVWLPKLGFTYDHVALVDGFASAGRYCDNQRGSPLIMLDAYVGRSASARARFKHPPHFVFIEGKKHFARHLRAELDCYPTLHGATVDLVHGTDEERFPEVIEYLAAAYRQPSISLSSE